MPCKAHTPRAPHRKFETILYPETPACVVRVRARDPGVLELCTIFRRKSGLRFAGSKRASATVAHTAGTSRNGVVSIRARSKRRCVGASSEQKEVAVVTAHASVAYAHTHEPYAFEEYPVVVLKGGWWMPCVVVDSVLAPSKYRQLRAAVGQALCAAVRPHLPGEIMRGSNAVVLTRAGTVERVLEYVRASESCSECVATVYSSAPPTKVYSP